MGTKVNKILYLRRDSLDQALLTSINRLNSNFQNFAQQFETVNANEFDNLNDVNILADIEHIASVDSSEVAPDIANLNEHDVDVLQLDLDDDVKGPKN